MGEPLASKQPSPRPRRGPPSRELPGERRRRTFLHVLHGDLGFLLNRVHRYLALSRCHTSSTGLCSTRHPPWAVKSVGDKWCTIITDATGLIAGMRINYGCTGGGFLLGNPNRSTPTLDDLLRTQRQGESVHADLARLCVVVSAAVALPPKRLRGTWPKERLPLPRSEP
jgi:hypothetical protein